jgi:transposase InsO family protein
MDLLGPFDPPTDRGNRYILVMSDVFSKWTTAYPIPNKEAGTVCRAFADHANKFGYPRRIHSDQGTEFQNELVKTIATTMGIEQTRTTAYRPQSDGQVERFNRTLIKMLKSFVADFTNCTTWDELLPMLTSAYNATEHTSTGCTPNLLFLGREANLPVDIIAGTPPRQRRFYNYSSYAVWLHHAMSKAYEYARISLQRAATRQKLYYDRKSSAWKPKPGEWVYYFYPPYARYKLGSPWTGPYVVVKELTARTYLIAAGPDAKPKVVHQDNLKSVLGRIQNQSNWVKEKLEKCVEIPAQTDAAVSPEPSDDEEDMIPSTVRSNEGAKEETSGAFPDATISMEEEEESDSDEESEAAVSTGAPNVPSQEEHQTQTHSNPSMDLIERSNPTIIIPPDRPQVQKIPEEVADTQIQAKPVIISESVPTCREQEKHNSDSIGHQASRRLPSETSLPLVTTKENILAPPSSNTVTCPTLIANEPSVAVARQDDTTFDRFWLESNPEIESDSALLAKYPVAGETLHPTQATENREIINEVVSNIATCSNELQGDTTKNNQIKSSVGEESLITRFEKLCINDSVPTVNVPATSGEGLTDPGLNVGAHTTTQDPMVSGQIGINSDEPLINKTNIDPTTVPDQVCVPRRSTRTRKPPDRYGYRICPVIHI